MTIEELFDRPRFQKSALATAPDDVLAQLAKLKDERADRLRKCTHLIKVGAVKESLRDEWVRDNPREAQRLNTTQIDERIVKASRDSDHALNAEIDRLEMTVARWPSDLAKQRKAESIAAHLQTPGSVAARERLERLHKRRDAMLEENSAGVGLTAAQRRSRDELSRAIVRCEIEAYEPLIRSDRQFA